MAVLLRLANDEGACDRRCYDAKEARCSCRVCGGLLHGVGYQSAMSLRSRMLRYLEGEPRPQGVELSRVERPKRRRDPVVVVLDKRVAERTVRRLRISPRVASQIGAGQLTLWRGAERPAPILPLRRPKRRQR